MLRQLLWQALVLAIFASGCGSLAVGGQLIKSDKPRDESPDVTAGDAQELTAGNTHFALDLYHQLATQDGNLFLSPHSISIALAMTYAGARGNTERQMADTLHFTLNQATLHPAFNALDLQLTSRGEQSQGRHGEPFRLHIVNALWGQDGYDFLPSFLDLLAQNYDAGMRLLDFEAGPEACRSEINRWVADQTEDRIRDLIPPRVITNATRLVLTNAIYFDAAWEAKFEKEDTQPGDFTLLDGSKVTVDMMHQTASFGYAEGEGYQAVELPYDGGELSMVILLPAAGRFSEFESALDADELAAVIAKLQQCEVGLAMPKLKYESAFRLKDALAAMGMPEAFIPGAADFSGMDGTRNLFIQEAVHKALVRVDEEGTEAAAATAVIIHMGVAPPQAVVEMTVDHPFIFLIRDRETGAILFLGRVLDPTTS